MKVGWGSLSSSQAPGHGAGPPAAHSPPPAQTPLPSLCKVLPRNGQAAGYSSEELALEPD